MPVNEDYLKPKKRELPSLHPVLDKLYTKTFSELQLAFAKFDKKNTTLDFHTFYNIVKTDLKADVQPDDVRTLFNKIDCYSKECITYWDLISFLQHFEEQRAFSASDVLPFMDTPTVYPCLRHNEIITQMILYPAVKGVHDEAAGHYILASQNGLVLYWTRDMKLKFQHPVQMEDDAENISIWVTGLTCFPREQILAVATTTCDIRFFRSNPYRFERLFSIVSLPQCITGMDGYAPARGSEPYSLAYGNTEGSVFMLKMSPVLFQNIKSRAVIRKKLDKISYAFIEKDLIPGLQVMSAKKQHYDQALKVMYVQNLKAVISCSANTERAMMVHHFDKNSSLCFTSSKGILCFEFCKSLNCIISGGMDYALKMWNPGVNSEPKDTLEGHSGPVTKCLVDEVRMLVISVDQCKVIRIWDLLRRICRQVLDCKEINLGPSRIASALCDPQKGRLILNTYKIAVFEPPKEVIRETHTQTVVFVAHNSVFNYAVTVGQQSCVSVWDIASGRQVSEYCKAHKTTRDRVEYTVEITTAGMDPSQRRLITGARDGSLKVWNFHIGKCLQEFCIKEGSPLLALGFLDFHIYATGWNRRIYVFYDDGSEVFEELWDIQHGDDIVGIDTYHRSLVASAACDGEIIIWFRENGFVKFRIKDHDVKPETDASKADDFSLHRPSGYSIDHILFLHSRMPHHTVGNLVTSGGDGLIRFWSVCSTCGLVAKFRAVFRSRDAVLCMATDQDNKYLITGDTFGYLRVYEIATYYSEENVPQVIPEPTSKHLEMFPFLRVQKAIEERHSKYSKFQVRFEKGAPLLLNCFNAHVHSIVQTAYVNGKDLILTGGCEGSVRLWALSGTFVGRFSLNEQWDMGCPVGDVFGKPAKMPRDVKRTVSPLSLKVFNSGKTPYWNRAIQLLSYNRMGDKGLITSDSIAGNYFYRSSQMVTIPKPEDTEEVLDFETPATLELTTDLAQSLARLGFITKAEDSANPEVDQKET